MNTNKLNTISIQEDVNDTINNKPNALVINGKDTVAVAIEDLKAGDSAFYSIDGEIRSINVVQDIPMFHKFLLKDINQDEKLFKYGQCIGRAIEDIKVGHHIHTHNVLSIRETIN